MPVDCKYLGRRPLAAGGGLRARPVGPGRGALPARPRRRGGRASTAAPRREIAAPDLVDDPGVELRARRRAARRSRRASTASCSRPACRSIGRWSRAARRRGLPVIAEVELAFPFLDGPVVGDHRLERQEHHHRADRRAARRRRPPRRGLRQHRRAAHRAASTARGGRVVRGRAVELPARDDRHLPAAGRGAAQRRARPPRPLRRPRAATPRRRSASSCASGPSDVAVLNADDPEVARRRWSRRAGALFSRAGARSPTAATRTASAVVEAEPGAEPRELFARRRPAARGQPQPRERDGGGAPGARARRRAGGDPRRPARLPRPAAPHCERVAETRRRGLLRRLQGHQRRRHGAARSRASPTARCT